MNIPRHAVLVAALVLPAMHGCTSGHESLPQEVTSAIENAFADNDPATLAAQFADDAELLVPNAPSIRGREAIDAYWKDQVRWVLSYDMTTIESRTFGDYGYHYATYSFRNVRRGRTVETGKVIEIWRRIDGDWRVYRTSWSQDRPPPAPIIGPVDEAESETGDS